MEKAAIGLVFDNWEYLIYRIDISTESKRKMRHIHVENIFLSFNYAQCSLPKFINALRTELCRREIT